MNSLNPFSPSSLEPFMYRRPEQYPTFPIFDPRVASSIERPNIHDRYGIED